MKQSQKEVGVRFIAIGPRHEGQRIDNFLFTAIKGVPKSLFYRLLRSGQIRVNKKRTKPDYRLVLDDVIRLPPLVSSEAKAAPQPTLALQEFLEGRILYEDDDFLVLNKPHGMAVHAGSNLQFGLIETLRAMRDNPELDLAHRLDRETSGCLLVAKNRLILNELQDLFKQKKIKKIYHALTLGRWKESECRVDLPLQKDEVHVTGKRLVHVDQDGKNALTYFKPLETFRGCSLVEVTLDTGRTHQIRVHAAACQHPLAGDDKYGDYDWNKKLRHQGLKRLFLHAHQLQFTLKKSENEFDFKADLDEDLAEFLKKLSE